MIPTFAKDVGRQGIAGYAHKRSDTVFHLSQEALRCREVIARSNYTRLYFSHPVGVMPDSKE